jgi:hypothetical protein
MPQETPDPVHLEQEAFRLRKSGHVRAAAELLTELLNEHPNWEHGYGAYAWQDVRNNLG